MPSGAVTGDSRLPPANKTHVASSPFAHLPLFFFRLLSGRDVFLFYIFKQTLSKRGCSRIPPNVIVSGTWDSQVASGLGGLSITVRKAP